jgi:hypothetical protein
LWVAGGFVASLKYHQQSTTHGLQKPNELKKLNEPNQRKELNEPNQRKELNELNEPNKLNEPSHSTNSP